MTDAVKMAKEADDLAYWLKDAAKILRANGTDLHAEWVEKAGCHFAALEQAGEPVAGIGHGEEADYAELKRLYNFSDDDSTQFTRWNMLTAIRHGKRLGQEFDAGEGEPVAFLYEKAGERFVALHNSFGVEKWTDEDRSIHTDKGFTETLLYAHPPQSRGQAFDGEGEGFLDALKVFAAFDRNISDDVPDDAHFAVDALTGWTATIGDVRAIRAALSSAKRGE